NEISGGIFGAQILPDGTVKRATHIIEGGNTGNVIYADRVADKDLSPRVVGLNGHQAPDYDKKIIRTGDGPDDIVTGRGSDEISTGGGEDRVRVRGENTVVAPGAGNDITTVMPGASAI